MHVVRVSRFLETSPVEAPGPDYLNAVVAGYTELDPRTFLVGLQAIEARLGRRRTTRNAPRVIDLDLILHSAHLVRGKSLSLPHPRYLQRPFVRIPLRELELAWRDPVTGTSLGR